MMAPTLSPGAGAVAGGSLVAERNASLASCLVRSTNAICCDASTARAPESQYRNAQFRQPLRTRDSLSRRRPGRRRRTHLRRFRRRTSRKLSRHRRHVRRNAEGGVGPPPTPHRVAPGPLRRPPPLIRRQDVKGFVNRKPVWLIRPLALDIVRGQAASMELETQNFYRKAAARATDAGIRQLLDDLAQEERVHEEDRK